LIPHPIDSDESYRNGYFYNSRIPKPNAYTGELFFFFKLCALRIPALPTGSRCLGTYRSLVRRYAEEFGIPTEIEVSDEVMVSALVLLWRKACIKLDSWDDQRGWRDFSELQQFTMWASVASDCI
jgi:hypothetical protein